MCTYASYETFNTLEKHTFIKHVESILGAMVQNMLNYSSITLVLNVAAMLKFAMPPHDFKHISGGFGVGGGVGGKSSIL